LTSDAPNSPAPSTLTLADLLGQIGEFTEDVIVITEADPQDGPGPRIVCVNPAFARVLASASGD